MQRSTQVLYHEVRLRAAAWARRLVEWHGDEAETVVRATLRRSDLTESEQLAARFTRDALADLRRRQAFARPPRRPSIAARFRWLFLFRRPAQGKQQLPRR